MSLSDFRGKVVAIAFIYTSCTDVCPMLTANMASVQDKLGSAFGSKIAFVSITVDPERDTPEVLKQYAENFGADLKGWSFLTGDPAIVREVGLKYGVIARKNGGWRRRPHAADVARRPQRHLARTISRCWVRPGGVPG